MMLLMSCMLYSGKMLVRKNSYNEGVQAFLESPTHLPLLVIELYYPTSMNMHDFSANFINIHEDSYITKIPFDSKVS